LACGIKLLYFYINPIQKKNISKILEEKKEQIKKGNIEDLKKSIQRFCLNAD